MSNEEKADIKLIKAEMERMNGHIKIFKGYGPTLDNIEIALVGSSLNGNDGLVSKIDKISKKIEDYETMRIQFNVAKVIFSIIAVAFIGNFISEKFYKKESKQQTENLK